MAIDPTKFKFLVVDDFSTMRRIVRNLLKELGFTNADEAEDGAVALQKLKGGGFEFVVTDWNIDRPFLGDKKSRLAVGDGAFVCAGRGNRRAVPQRA